MKGPSGPALAWLLALCCSCIGPGAPGVPPSWGSPHSKEDPIKGERLRAEALRRARVWSEPAVPISRADLRANPPGPDGFRPSDQVACRFWLTDSKGLSSKFQCILPDGDEIKVKYGRNNAEVFAEVAASRLLSALGFGADRMYVVAKVRCSGCPPFPYPRFRWLDALFEDKSRIRDFDWVAIERPAQGRPIEGESRVGWEWPELDRIDPSVGGASRPQVEALRLMAMFLNHWDAKAENHKLLCLADGETSDAVPDCGRPLAYLHDVGKTFGPKGVDLESWSSSPIWKDPTTCRVSMESLPYQGASFGEATLSEEGRLFLAQRLGQLSEAQISDLFAGARFPEFRRGGVASHPLDAWVAAFLRRVREIADRPPCLPETTASLP